MIRFSTMSEQDAADYRATYTTMSAIQIPGFPYMQPAEEFDENGLRFPIDYLNATGTAIIFLPLEMMADYVDVVSKHAIDSNDKTFIDHHFIRHGSDSKTFNVDSVNCTAIGNLAYAALNCKNELAKEIAEDALERIFTAALEKGKYKLKDLFDKMDRFKKK